MDQLLLRLGIRLGVELGRIAYPEAGAILRHYLNGNGAELKLSANYFRKSSYLEMEIQKRSNGIHGPIAFNPSKDWRLALALNPYYLDIKDSTIRIFHPRIQFADISSPPVITMVPIGKLRIRFYDNLISILGPRPFFVYAEWPRMP